MAANVVNAPALTVYRVQCKFFVREYGEDLVDKLEDHEPIYQICDELNYQRTSPIRRLDQSDARKFANIRQAEQERRCASLGKSVEWFE